MAITLSATYYITLNYVAGDPKGDSWTNPYTMDDIIAFSESCTRIVTHALNNGGSGYAINDTFTVDSGTTLARGKVLTVDGSGVVLTYEILEGAEGNGYSIANNVATTKTIGSGTGLTIDITALGTLRSVKAGTCYYIPYPILFQTGYFWDYGKNVEIYINPNIIATNGTGIQIDGMNFRSGRLSNTIAVNISMVWSFTNNTRNANFNIYPYASAVEISFWNTLLSGIYSISLSGGYNGSVTFDKVTYNNCRIVFNGIETTYTWKNIRVYGQTWVYQYYGNGIVENIDIHSANNPIFRNVSATNFNSTVKNLNLIGATVGQQFIIALRTISQWNFVDCNITKASNLVGWQNITANADISVNLISTFKFNLDPNTVGGNLTLYDKDDNEILNQAITTNVFEEEIIYFQFRGVVDALGVQSDNISDRCPFKLKITNDCCETLLMENIVINSGNTTNINATLKTQVPVIVTPDNMYIKTNPENYGANRDAAV